MDRPVTPDDIRRAKSERRKLACLTAYDYPTARLLDESGVDVILVGDSVGMVVLGHPDTTLVTMADMVHHTRIAARGREARAAGVRPALSQLRKSAARRWRIRGA